MKLPMLRHDLANHFVYGTFIFCSCTAIALIVMSAMSFLSLLIAAEIGLFFTLVFALGKEIRDRVTGKGTSSWEDIAATAAGGIIPFILLAILHFL